MKNFIVTIQHDKGRSKIQIAASCHAAARDGVCFAENCPKSAVVSVKELFKTSQELYDEILRPVNTKYGAPMGRSDKGEKPSDCRIFDRYVPLTDGYDKGGAYWGLGPQLRVKFSQDGTYVEFYRIEYSY
jgi:hypothetical protein